MQRVRSIWLRSSKACARVLLGLAFTSLPISAGQASEYQVDVGDVLELTAASIPEFRHRATVGGDGEVVFPLVGMLSARGKTVSEILNVIQVRIPQKVLRRRALDGSEHVIVIDGDEVSLIIAEYNPVYLKGDVSRPGSYPYRPGLMIRQAIALAGGYDTMRTRIENPYLLTADLNSERETLMNGYARQEARIARVQTELGQGVQESDMRTVSPTAIDISALEVERLNTRKSDFEKEKQHLAESIRSLTASVDLLEKQLQTEAERAKIDQEDMIRVEGLAAKGMATAVRLSDTRRLVLLSASRATEVEARAVQVKQLRAEQQRKLQKLFDDRRLELLKELQDAKLELAATASKLSAVTEKMFLVSAIRSQVGRGGTGVPDLVVVRKAASGTVRLVATEETELLPGDVIDVALHVDSHPYANGQQLRARGRLGSLPSDIEAR
jgi:polysaccharide export outer membrane protein